MTLPARALLAALRFARSPRAGAGLELAVGTAMLFVVAFAAFDLYSRVRATQVISHAAVAMASHISQEPAPQGSDLLELATFLYEDVIAVPSSLLFVLTAVRQPPDPADPVALVWTDSQLALGDASLASAVAANCSRFVSASDPVLPADFTPLDPGDVVIIVEVCARLTREGSFSGLFLDHDLYRFYFMPYRHVGTSPAAPTALPP